MSRAKLQVFVEGRDLDSYVYGRICRSALPHLFDYRTTRADELTPAGTGGKQALLAFFSNLRRKKQLVVDFKGQKSGTLFFLDKDLDDLLRKQKRSPHVVYTRSYDIEAEVFREGDIVDAVAALCSLDPTAVQARQQPTDWRHLALNSRRDWVDYCVAAKTHPSLNLTSYSNVSLMHSKGQLQTDPLKVATISARLAAECSTAGLSLTQVKLKAARQVSRSYASSGGYEVFKGKWFPEVIHTLAVSHFPVEAGRVTSFKSRLAGHMAQSMSMQAPWVQHYSTPIVAIVAQL
ncbi:hypothetical protein VH571_13155 [Frondihabitans sp. 4ASC-45]|uniref:hypothetical protein n=1 Tax=Frondihabitans sp. 4ASC-45 TaxID=3111636 RepID=UPI003C271035